MNIVPYESLDQIRFGMPRDEVRKAVGVSFTEFVRNEFSAAPTDNFDTLSLFVNYDSAHRCEAIELAPPAEANFMGKDLLAMSFAEAAKWISTLDAKLHVDEAGLTSYKFGLGLYAPDHQDSPEKPSESVIVFRKGYYD
jgi:hypothetical protein